MEYDVVFVEGFSRVTRWEGYQKQGARNVGIFEDDRGGRGKPAMPDQIKPSLIV